MWGGFWQVSCPAVITVTVAADSGEGSLRQGLADVCAGGDINLDGDTLVMTNSTVYSNSGYTTIFGYNSQLTLQNSVVYSNTNGGLELNIGSTLTMTNVIIGGTAGSGDCVNAGTTAVNSNNLVEDGETIVIPETGSSGTITMTVQIPAGVANDTFALIYSKLTTTRGGGLNYCTWKVRCYLFSETIFLVWLRLLHLCRAAILHTF
ncbi:MAG: hypothetical protein Kow0031_26150 [Anaerolineae bacterium]